MYIYVYIYVCMYVYIHIYIYTYPSLSLALSLSPSLHLSLSTLNPIHTARVASQFGGGFYVGKIPLSLSLSTFNPIDDDDKFTPTKHLTPPPHHSSRPAAAHIDSETPLLHKKKGRIHNVVFFSQFGGGFYVGKIPAPVLSAQKKRSLITRTSGDMSVFTSGEKAMDAVFGPEGGKML